MPTSRLAYYEQLLPDLEALQHTQAVEAERERKQQLLAHCVFDEVPQTLEEFEQAHPSIEPKND